MRVPERLREFRWGAPQTYLGLEGRAADFARARALVLPVPYESTTSYGGGTRNGPQAIIEASRQVELYDHELNEDPYEVGISTLPALELTAAGADGAMAELRAAYAALLDEVPGKFIVMLGGEHSITAPPVLAWADQDRGRRLSVLQLDAHADLRPEYAGTPSSHASVMHRVHERVDIVGVGIRSLTREERQLARRSEEIHLFMADDLDGTQDWIDRVVERLTGDVYITVDLDVFDSSLVPSTGTPEPGGLGWYPALKLLRQVFRDRNVLACDIVELAPIPGLSAPDYLAAKLAYKLIGYKFFA